VCHTLPEILKMLFRRDIFGDLLTQPAAAAH